MQDPPIYAVTGAEAHDMSARVLAKSPGARSDQPKRKNRAWCIGRSVGHHSIILGVYRGHRCVYIYMYVYIYVHIGVIKLG